MPAPGSAKSLGDSSDGCDHSCKGGGATALGAEDGSTPTPGVEESKPSAPGAEEGAGWAEARAPALGQEEGSLSALLPALGWGDGTPFPTGRTQIGAAIPLSGKKHTHGFGLVRPEKGKGAWPQLRPGLCLWSPSRR